MDYMVEQFFLEIIILLIGGIGTVAWFLIKKFFFKDSNNKSGVSAGGDINSNIIATDNAKVTKEGDNIVYQQNFILSQHPAQKPTVAQMPIAKPTEQNEVDKEARSEVEAIMKRQPTKENKERLRNLFYATTDGVLKIQIALVLGPWFDPMEDVTTELIEMTNEAIPLARLANAQPQLAALYAYKGVYYTFLFTHEHREFDYKLVIHQGKMDGLMDFYQKEMAYKENYLQECFDNAVKIALKANDYEAIAAVYMEIGQSAAHRATIYTTELSKREASKTLMREAYTNAEKAYADAADKLPNNGELEIANVQHNLANALRMLGIAETKEAIEIEEKVLKVSDKLGDPVLKRKAEVLLQHMKSGDIPNYMGGEKGEELF